MNQIFYRESTSSLKFYPASLDDLMQENSDLKNKYNHLSQKIDCLLPKWSRYRRIDEYKKTVEFIQKTPWTKLLPLLPLSPGILVLAAIELFYDVIDIKGIKASLSSRIVERCGKTEKDILGEVETFLDLYQQNLIVEKVNGCLSQFEQMMSRRLKID